MINPIRKRRLNMIAVIVLGSALAAFFVTKALNENLTFFFTPSDIIAGNAPQGQLFRAGGMVVEGSVKKDGLNNRFAITDMEHNVTVKFTGILPDLFREGQGIVALGTLGNDNIFNAQEVLAKHDENYMPPEVADSMKGKY